MKKQTKNHAPTVFIHGAGGGGWEWQYWAICFSSAGWACHTPTLKGNGKTNLAEVTFLDYIKELTKLIDSLPKKPIIIGASMGGILAQKLAEQGKAEAIILVNSAPPKGVASASWPTNNNDPAAIIKWSTESTLKDTRDCMPEADEKTILWAHPQWRDESGKVIREIRAGISIKKRNISCPVLVIAGKNDKDITCEVSRAVSEFYDADYFAFAGVSHVGALLGKRYWEIASQVSVWIKKLE